MGCNGYFSFLKPINKELQANLSVLKLKEITSTNDDKNFFTHWLNANEFLISLNFSIGTNYVFDIHYKTKSSIIAHGVVEELDDNTVKIKLQTSTKYWLFTILTIPFFALTVNFIFDLEIPLFLLILIFPFFLCIYFMLHLIVFEEEKKLIASFIKIIKAQ
ncbi:hypothetical protein [Lacinutrix salivirga]